MKTILITGASGAMGSAAVRKLAGDGHTVWMACRNLEKGESIRQQILQEYPEADIRLKVLDLSSFASVKTFAAELKKDGVRLDALFNNAGTMNRHYSETADGIERTWQVNFLSPCLLTRLLLPMMAPDAHIVSMVSLSAHYARLDAAFPLSDKKHFTQLGTYAQSKLALLLYTLELSRRVPQYVNMSDPWIVNTPIIHLDRWFDPIADLFFRPLCYKPEKGVQPALRALFTEERGKYFVGKSIRDYLPKYGKRYDLQDVWTRVEAFLASQAPLEPL